MSWVYIWFYKTIRKHASPANARLQPHSEAIMMEWLNNPKAPMLSATTELNFATWLKLKHTCLDKLQRSSNVDVASVNWRATTGLFLCFGNELKAILDASNRMLTLRSSVSNPLVVKSDRDLSTPNSHPAAARRAMPGRPLVFTHWQWQHFPLFYDILFNQNTFSGIMIQDGNMGWLWESGAQICKEPYHLSYIGAKHTDFTGD